MPCCSEIYCRCARSRCSARCPIGWGVLGTILGGGLAPLIATALMVASEDDIASVVYYFAGLCVMALIAAMMTRETRGREL